jgi:hypothetical protein
MLEAPLLDGFILSASQLYLPIIYRASALAQMEVLRRSRGYRTRWYLVPDDLEDPIPAYGQVELQINVPPGSYLWGLAFTIPTRLNDSLSTTVCHVQITDACTETAIFSDYVMEQNVVSLVPGNGGQNRRNPMILAQPALIGQPGLVDVEIFNGSTDGSTPPVGVTLNCQLALLFAEPCVPPEEMQRLMRIAGII